MNKGIKTHTLSFAKGAISSTNLTVQMKTANAGGSSASNIEAITAIFDYQYSVAEYDSAKTSYEALATFSTPYMGNPKTARLSPGVTLPSTNTITKASGTTIAIANSFTYDLSTDTLTVMGLGMKGDGTSVVMGHFIKPRIGDPDYTLDTSATLGITVSAGNRETPVSYTPLRAHVPKAHLACRLMPATTQHKQQHNRLPNRVCLINKTHIHKHMNKT
ncbi:MAG: hypothetical protein MPK62_14260, partial [Alphaproteobacteria bacterium]|nr:hypothetical protein [Alphaproteobacteria bacterium]